MTDEPINLVLEQLRAIRAEQTLTWTRIGTLTESMVSVRKHIDDLNGHIQGLCADVRRLARKLAAAPIRRKPMT